MKNCLDKNKVYVFILKVKDYIPNNTYQLLTDYCSPQRQIKLSKYKLFEDRKRALFSELLLRYALNRYFAIEQEKIHFQLNDYQKPYLCNWDNIYFNISHAGDYVTCVIANEEVGIDIEKIQEIECKEICKYFNDKEQILFELVKPEERLALFYKIWVAKESYIKYISKGLSYPLHSFYVNFDDNTIIDKEKSHPAAYIHLDDIEEYALSICAKNRKSIIRKEVSLNVLIHYYMH